MTTSGSWTSGALYTHCLSTGETQAALLDANKLREVSLVRLPSINARQSPAEEAEVHGQSNLPPAWQLMCAPWRHHAACMQEIWQMSAGEPDVAMDQFRDVLQNHGGADYSYYTTQAKERLSHLALTFAGSAPLVRPRSRHLSYVRWLSPATSSSNN